MLYTDKEILETILEASISLCSVLLSLLEDDLRDSEAYKLANIASFQLCAAADMFFYNVRNRCSEEYDD